MNETIRPAASLKGTVALPGDKSVAHRTALFAALADGPSTIRNYPASADPQSTLGCLRQLGVTVTQAAGLVHVEGRGRGGWRPPAAPLDCGNSGTTMRLLAGVLAGQPFPSTLVGDASLSRRPMARIADPLREMGAQIELTDGHAPIRIHGNPALRGMTYRLPVPSAQVKSCVLLAGLFADGETVVIETVASRDHTERMLGLPVVGPAQQRHITATRDHRILPRQWVVPGDFSAAAFFLVAGSIVPGSELWVPGVGLNPSRTALLEVLREMGADLTVENARAEGGEPVGDLRVRAARLRSMTLDAAVVPNLIDEIPVLAVAATQAEGTTVLRHAEELRVKETDRIAAMVTNLRALGAEVEAFDDGLAVTGGVPLRGATVEAFDDHRIAMAMGVAGLVADGATTIRDADTASVSFPDFWTQLEALRV